MSVVSLAEAVDEAAHRVGVEEGHGGTQKWQLAWRREGSTCRFLEAPHQPELVQER